MKIIDKFCDKIGIGVPPDEAEGKLEEAPAAAPETRTDAIPWLGEYRACYER